MQYTKRPLTIEEQIDRLEQRGLNFSDKVHASRYLQNINYYRLRASHTRFRTTAIPLLITNFSVMTLILWILLTYMYLTVA